MIQNKYIYGIVKSYLEFSFLWNICSSSSKREFIEVGLTELAEVFNIIAHMKFGPEFSNLQIVNNNVHK